jgi:hypothetical protein
MSSSKSLSMSMFAGLRVNRTTFTPEYSKNGKNISAKLTINAFCNTSKDDSGKNDAFNFTVWGKLAHICAKSMSPGKEFSCVATLHLYDGRVFNKSTVAGTPGTPVMGSDGQPLTTKKPSFTIREISFGADSKKHIAKEIAAQVRPVGWDIDGSATQAQWKEILKARQAVQFNPNSPTYGYAKVQMPQGAGIAAYIQNGNVATTGAAVTPAAVAATFAGVNPAPAAPAVPKVNAGFVMPAGV